MISAARFHPGPLARLLIASIGVVLFASSWYGQSEACTLPPDHAGLTFPVERVDPAWACRLRSIIQNNSIESQVGPILTALSGALYRYLLDDPPFAAALIRRLKLGLYQSEGRGPRRFWGDDGEGSKGIVEVVYEDPTSRIYFLEGTHESRLLPHLKGKAVVFLRIGIMQDENSHETTVSTLVAYTKLDNPFLSGLASILHPLVSRIAASRLKKGVETVDRLGVVMRLNPQRVLAEAQNPPSLPEHHVAFLKQVLIRQHIPENGSSEGRSIP
ncbi:MAG: hypothetical protein OEU68_14910 [Nitrospira sp.]|nr:hypothetical protein [Nitrospira sp.]MDH4357434.1 hypothetical protein [Nitrospira sp.]MDH5319913.1 hypothetical protein [Nitrospira sp.]